MSAENVNNRTSLHTLRLRSLLGERVRTPDGVGILLGKETPSNGLYFEDDRSTWLVWYGTGNPEAPKWVSRTYRPEDIEAADEAAGGGTGAERDLGITGEADAKSKVSDVVIVGDTDLFLLLAKASSKEQGWMKSTKAMEVSGGCLVQVTTQQRNPDGSYSVAEALTYVPGVMIEEDKNGGRKLVPIRD